jgi:hypothetical protein
MIFALDIAHRVPLPFGPFLLLSPLLPSRCSDVAPADDVVRISATLQYWQAYDSSIKTDLFASAVTTSQGLLIVDPIPLESKLLQELAEERPIVGVFVTNINHCRVAATVAEKFCTPIFGHRATIAACELAPAQEVRDGEKFARDLCAISIEGAAGGEMAIYHESDGGAWIIGDSLINFEPYGFTFLPQKYCLNQDEMRRSLRHLLEYKFERMLFAHGTPLVHSAREKLEELFRHNE